MVTLAGGEPLDLSHEIQSKELCKGQEQSNTEHKRQDLESRSKGDASLFLLVSVETGVANRFFFLLHRKLLVIACRDYPSKENQELLKPCLALQPLLPFTHFAFLLAYTAR